MEQTWKTVRLALSVPFWAAGAVLTFYIGLNVFGFIRNSSEHYATFVLAIVVMTGLLALRNAVDRQGGRAPDWRFWARLAAALLGSLLATAGAGFVLLNAVRFEMIQPFFEPFDVQMGLVLAAGILILTWIHWGPLLTAIVVGAIVYFFYGHQIGNVLFAHPEYDTNFVMNYVSLGTNQGFYWLAQVAADSIYFLIFYAAILLGLGMLQMVLEIGKVSGRYIHGGASFPAIVGSGIVASVMGQAVSNVVLTGRFTIPMMKENGYRASMAGAIEAVASTSGQIMPPILGLAGFIIASFLNVPYIEVALSALIPAFLFLSGVTIGILIYARRYKLPKLETRADRKLILRMLPAFLGSFIVVLVLLLNYHSPAFAGLAGTAVALVLCLFQGRYRPKLKKFLESVEDGLVLIALLSLLLIAIGPLGQVILTTNLSGRLGAALVGILPDIKVVLLLGAMVVSLVLGMGLPTPVAYVVVVLALSPFLQQLGVPALHAHFFVFYFAVFSTLTPPVAVSVLAAAKLANARFLDTAADAMKLAVTTFLIPFAFVFHPQLLSFPNLTWSVIPPVVLLLVLQWTVSVAAYGYFRRNLGAVERTAFTLVSLAGFLAIVTPGATTKLLFALLLVLTMGWILLAPAGRAAALANTEPRRNEESS
ncbi:MAG: TRAP transporter fused permease subunit [Kiloniellales bacterium]